MSTTAQSPLGLFATDDLIGEEDKAIRDTVRRFVDDRIRPGIADWYEQGSVLRVDAGGMRLEVLGNPRSRL